jgi:hypothetical protein
MQDEKTFLNENTYFSVIQAQQEDFLLEFARDSLRRRFSLMKIHIFL